MNGAAISNDFIADSYKTLIPTSFYDYCIEQEALSHEALSEVDKGEIIYAVAKKSGVHNADLTLAYQQIALDIFKSIGHDSLEHMVTASMCFPYISKGMYDEAESLIKKALSYWIEVDNNIWIPATYSKFGLLEKSRGNYINAIEYYLKSYKKYLEYREKSSLGGLYNNIGIAYMSIGDYDRAVQYFEEFLTESELSDKPVRWQVTVMTNAAECYTELGKDSIARSYYEKTNDIWLNSSSSKFKTNALIRKSSYSQKDGLPNQAKVELDSALHYAYLFGESKSIADAEFAYYELIAKTEKSIAISHLKKAYQHAKQSSYIPMVQSCTEELSTHYRKKNKLSLALKYDIESDSLKKILFSEDIASQIKRLDIKIQQEQSVKEMALLQEQNLLKEQNIQYQKKIRNTLFGLFVFALISIALLYYLFKQRSKTSTSLAKKNKTITSALEQNKMLMKEVHHRVKNNLQVVSSLLYLQSRYIDDNSAKDALQIGRSRVQAMSLLHQKLYQNENIQEVNIKSYFTELCESLFHNYKSPNRNISYQLEIDDLELDIELVIPMGLIVNELISNALQHAFNKQDEGEITLKIIQQNKSILLSVTDNGSGLAFDSIPERADSLGLELVKSFSEKIGGDLSIKNENGTSFIIIFEKEIQLNI